MTASDRLGAFGERVWQHVFLGAGLFYIKLSDLPPLNGQGPRLQGNGAILPDFHVSGKRNAYVDSKCKSRSVRYDLADEVRHGFDRKDWDSYAAVSALHRSKVLLGVVELHHEDGETWSGELLVQSLGTLGQPIGGIGTQSHMIYWPRNKFRSIARLSKSELRNIADGSCSPPPHVGESLLEVMGPGDDDGPNQRILF